MAPMERLSPGVYRGQKGGLVQSKTGMIPKAKPKLPGVGQDMANKMAGGQMKPTNVPNRNVQPMPRGGGMFSDLNKLIGEQPQMPKMPSFQPPGPGPQDLLHTMPFNGVPQPGKGQPNMQDYLKQFDQGQADVSGLEDLFGRMRGNMQMQGLLGSLNKGF